MLKNPIITAALGAVIAMVIYDMFVKDLVSKSNFDANF